MMWDKTGGRCWYCGTQTNPWKTFCIDHVIPESCGGSQDTTNLVPCCRRCNGQKGNMDLESFRSLLAKRAGKIFTTQQIDYLRSVGLELPEQAEQKHVFFFELNGLTT